jgi:pimeloyl-ACP methyl ester carboxylesterase
VFCHGFISDKSGSYVDRCERAVAAGYNAVRFDFRGCGESSGDFIDQTLSSRITDLTTVSEYFDLDGYVVFGSSFGGKVAFHTAVIEPEISAIGARAPVTYQGSFDERRQTIDEEGVYEYETGHRLDERFFEDLDAYSFSSIVDKIDCPVCVFHGGMDASVPIEHSFRAAAALDTDVVVYKYAQEGHRFSREAESRMQEQFFYWLDEQR